MSEHFEKLPEVTKKKRRVSKKATWMLVTVSLFVILFGTGTAGMYWYEKNYNDKVYIGVSINNTSLSGLTKDEARQVIKAEVANLLDDGLRFNYDGNEKVVTADNNPDLISVNIETMTNQAYSLGRTGKGYMQWLQRFGLLVNKTEILLDYELDKVGLERELRLLFAEFENPAQNSDIAIEVTDADAHEYIMMFTPESAGKSLSYDSAFSRLQSRLKFFENPVIQLHLVSEEPTITQVEAEQMRNSIKDYLLLDDLTLEYKEKDISFPVSWSEFTTWLSLKRNDAGEIVVDVNSSVLTDYLRTLAKDNINQPAHNAVLEMENEKVIKFEPQQTGVELKLYPTLESIHTTLIQNKKTNIPLIVDVAEPEVTLADLNDLGIKELLGTGFSNFSGSPSNRVKNISHATYDKLNGTLIKPGEEFSLIAATKPYTIAGGYLPELVIKGDEIKPEIGGGLCQIGTTLFRAVMNAGLEVTQRRNHSLVVSYYNDPRNGNPGTDATIYDPAPDFKFINDTGAYLLLTTSMNPSTGELYYSFWGTSDGRKGYYSEPVVQRWISAGPQKEIVSKDLAPGARKCQIGHTGAETSFTYYRERPNKEVEEVVFSSYYRALPKTCLIGPEKEETPTASDTSSEATAAPDEEPEALPDIQAPVETPPNEPVSEAPTNVLPKT